MIYILRKFDEFLIKIVSALIVVSSVAMSSLVFFLVLSRYFFGSSIIGVLELATIFAIWLYMLGAILASRNKEHLTVDILELTISDPKKLAIYDLARSTLVLLPSIFVVYLAYDMLGWSTKRPQTTPALSLPLLIQQSPMMFATIFFVAYAIRDIFTALQRIHSLKRKE